MPKPLGMLEPGHRDHDDRGRTLHAGLRILRRDYRQAVRARRRRTAARGRGRAPDGFEACRRYRRRPRRPERWRRESFCPHDRSDSCDGPFGHHRGFGSRLPCPGMVYPNRPRRRARHLQSQHGDRRAVNACRCARARNTGPRSMSCARRKSFRPAAAGS